MRWGLPATCRASSAVSRFRPGRTSGFPAKSVCGQSVEVLAPALFALDAELVKVIPGINAGVVQIVEGDLYGVIADRFEPHDADMGAAVDQRLLSRTVALNLRGRALDAQVFGGKGKMTAVIERDIEPLFRPLQAQLHWPARCSARAHGTPSG